MQGKPGLHFPVHTQCGDFSLLSHQEPAQCPPQVRKVPEAPCPASLPLEDNSTKDSEGKSWYHLHGWWGLSAWLPLPCWGVAGAWINLQEGVSLQPAAPPNSTEVPNSRSTWRTREPQNWGGPAARHYPPRHCSTSCSCNPGSIIHTICLFQPGV